MTVENTNPIQHFTANGETTVFAISFAVEGKDNIKVTVNGSVVSVNDYSYDALTKAVVFNAAPEDGAEVVVERVTSLDRSINYQTYNNSFRPETLNYDLDRIWHVLQEDKITDAEILARIKDEIEWRRTHNTEWDLLAQAREKGLFNALKSYMDAIGAMSVPNLFDGITDNVVITEEGVSQRVTNRGLKQAQAELLEALNSLNETVNVNLAEAKTYTDDEKARAIAEETRISNTVVAETNRAVVAEAVLQGQINALGVGNKAYKTYAEMALDTANITANSKVTVTNDTDTALNGDYQFDGTNFTKSSYDILTQAKEYTASYIATTAQDLFKLEVNLELKNNMPVRRYVSETSSNDYSSGTYQTQVGNAVQLSVPASGSSAIKHYFHTGINPQVFEASFVVTKLNIQGDAIGIGFYFGATYTSIAYSNSGNLAQLTNFSSTNLKTGLGNYGVGDKVTFKYADKRLSVFVNGTLKATQDIELLGEIVIAQGGFSHYEATFIGEVIDPVREYVKSEISFLSDSGLSSCYYSYDSISEIFYAYSKVKSNLYVGFEVRHEVDKRENIYLDYWRLYQAYFYTFESGVMTNTGKYAVIGGENEFVFKQDSTKDDFTGGYHGDEQVTDLKIMVDGFPISTANSIPLTAASKVEYIEKSTMHETASGGVVVEGHPIVAYHTKHTTFKDGGYKTWNHVKWNYAGTLSTLYHGISCISKDVATVGFSDDTFTDQLMTGSDANYFTAIGTRLFKARNESNGLAVEATAYQLKVDGADELSEFFVKDRVNDSKYYRKSPPRLVGVGEVHESSFECKFLAV